MFLSFFPLDHYAAVTSSLHSSYVISEICSSIITCFNVNLLYIKFDELLLEDEMIVLVIETVDSRL